MIEDEGGDLRPGARVRCVGGCCDGKPYPGRGVIVEPGAVEYLSRGARYLGHDPVLVLWETGSQEREWVDRVRLVESVAS